MLKPATIVAAAGMISLAPLATALPAAANSPIARIPPPSNATPDGPPVQIPSCTIRDSAAIARTAGGVGLPYIDPRAATPS
jgi:hypothetical protein